MDEKISFIPKKTIEHKFYRGSGAGAGLFVVISFIIFFISAGVWGGLLFYKNLTEKENQRLMDSIKKDKDSFSSSLSLVKEMAKLSDKVKTAKQLLGAHRVASSIFRLLEDSTIKNVRFNDLDYSLKEEGNPTLSLSGLARDYGSLAQQTELFQKNSAMRSAVFSGLGLDQKGLVKFNVKIELDPSVIAYKAEQQ